MMECSHCIWHILNGEDGQQFDGQEITTTHEKMKIALLYEDFEDVAMVGNKRDTASNSPKGLPHKSRCYAQPQDANLPAISQEQGVSYHPHPYQLGMMNIGSSLGEPHHPALKMSPLNAPEKGTAAQMFHPYRDGRFGDPREDKHLHTPNEAPSSTLTPHYIKQIGYGGLAGLQEKVKMADTHFPGREGGNMFQPYKSDGSGGYVPHLGPQYMKQGYLYGSLAIQDKMQVPDYHVPGHVPQPCRENRYGDHVVSPERHLQALGAATSSSHALQYASHGGYGYGSQSTLQNRLKMEDSPVTATTDHRAVDRNVHNILTATTALASGYEKQSSLYAQNEVPTHLEKVKMMEFEVSKRDSVGHSFPPRAAVVFHGGTPHRMASVYTEQSSPLHGGLGDSTVGGNVGRTDIPVAGQDTLRHNFQSHSEGRYIKDGPIPATQCKRENSAESQPTKTREVLVDVQDKEDNIEGNDACHPSTGLWPKIRGSDASPPAEDQTNVSDAPGKVSGCVSIQLLKGDGDGTSGTLQPQASKVGDGDGVGITLNERKVWDISAGNLTGKKMSDDEDSDDGSSEDSEEDSSDDSDDDDSNDGSLTEDSEVAPNPAVHKTPAPGHEKESKIHAREVNVEAGGFHHQDHKGSSRNAEEAASQGQTTPREEENRSGVTAECRATAEVGFTPRGMHRKMLPYKKDFVLGHDATAVGGPMPQSKEINKDQGDKPGVDTTHSSRKAENGSGQVPVPKEPKDSGEGAGGNSDLPAAAGDVTHMRTEGEEITGNAADGSSDAPVRDCSPRRVTRSRKRRVVVEAKVEDCGADEESIERYGPDNQTGEIVEYIKPRDPRLRPRRKRTLVSKFDDPGSEFKLRRSPRKQERPVRKRPEREPAEPEVRPQSDRPVRKEKPLKPLKVVREKKERRPRGRLSRKPEKPRQCTKKKRSKRVEYQWKDMPITYVCKACEHRPSSLGMACIHLLQVHRPITVPLYDYLTSHRVPGTQKTLYSFILKDPKVNSADGTTYSKDVPMGDGEDDGNIMVIGAMEDDLNARETERDNLSASHTTAGHELTNHKQVDVDRDCSRSGDHLETDDPAMRNDPRIKIEFSVKNDEELEGTEKGGKEGGTGYTGKPFQESSLLEQHEFVKLLIRWLDIDAICPKCNCKQRGRKMTHVHHCRAMGLQKLCETCGKYIHNHSFKSHVAREHDHISKIRRVICPHCGKEMSTTTIAHHVKTFHQGEVIKVPCGICGKLLSSNHSLKRHEAIHRAEVRYHCPVCKRGFTQSTNMKNHLRQHTGEQPYQCELCGKAFTHKVSMKTHLKKHHGIDLWKLGHSGGGRPKQERTGDSGGIHRKQETRVEAVTAEEMQDSHPHGQLVERAVSGLGEETKQDSHLQGGLVQRAVCGHGEETKQDVHPDSQLVQRAVFGHREKTKRDIHPHSLLVERAVYGQSAEHIGHLPSQSGETREHGRSSDERSRVEVMEGFHSQGGGSTRVESVRDLHPHSQVVGRPTMGHGMASAGHHHTQRHSGESEMQRHRHSGGGGTSRQELIGGFHSQGGPWMELGGDLHVHSQLIGRPGFGQGMELMGNLHS